MKERLETSVRVSGRGDTKQKAIADALSAVQRTVLKESSNIILRIEPVNVEVVQATVKTSHEKFLFFFLPRKRELYSVVLDVALDVTLLNVQEIHFESA
ncbi:hypothetical protein SOASR030_06110 [Leminorella grimontii]|uniref:Cytoplasmic protein n=1 Tax=Leminorella grimontii TaxID=82981 RepID=A0AAV5N026_9GAMM|nr:DUF4312 family protein [Leminorella grimontii]KFC96310.1 putative cytoplasmic protein [Leminorella grimontii ATCC 33999 = DSM 5078]GKX54499.1 hypothetical protein SOASR030_06110 [Leminorella grimontii]GKX57916.1 hypothetical protein SOASR031_02310 [Leminorella grimontii]VFS59091.1 Uncharacterised protein [Leminorella grimontii]